MTAHQGDMMRQRHVIGYRTISESTPTDLDDEIERLLGQGWMMYGDPRYQAENRFECASYQQTMVRYGDCEGTDALSDGDDPDWVEGPNGMVRGG